MRRGSVMAQWRLAAGTGLGLLVAVVAGFEARGQVSGPGGQGAAIKSEVQIVLLDVVVTDANQRPVTGLRKDDFQVVEDGRPQTISFFEEHTGGTVSAVALPPTPAAPP